VLGLEVSDVSFQRNTVTFRPNRFRRLKTATSARVVPLSPQLRDILHAYLNVRTATMVLHDAPASSLLFPSFRTGAESLLVELRKIFDRVALRGRVEGCRNTEPGPAAHLLRFEASDA
jgi:integrase